MKVRLLAFVLFIALGIVAVFVNVSGKVSRKQEYETAIAAAHSNAERDIPYTAVRQFERAFAVQCTDEKEYQKYTEQCKKLGDDFYSQAMENYIVRFPQSTEAYEQLCRYYYDEENYGKVIKTALASREAGAASDKLKKMYTECYYRFDYIRDEMEEAGRFLGDSALIKQEGKYGYVDGDGESLLANAYDRAYPFLGTTTAVKAEGIWVMINSEGYVVARPSQDVDEMSFISNERVTIAKNGKYGYTDAGLTVPEELPYDYASIFRNGVAAVQKDNEWKLIDTEEKPVTDKVFEDILIDEFNTCISSGVIWAKMDGKYYMLDAEGKRLSDQGFDDVQPFVSDGPAAVCKDGKWGFVDKSGELVIPNEYSGARSFNIGIGAVCKDGKWGYISQGGETRIKPEFDDCKAFSDNGVAAVKQGDRWSYIKILGTEE